MVIGSGPGGYVAAIRAGQLGLKTAIVERDELGGVCLNWGCIPSKALLRNAEVLGLIKRADQFGITVGEVIPDFGKAVDRSRKVVSRLTRGIGFLLKKNNVEQIKGFGSLKDRTTVSVEGGHHTLTTKNILIATGARFRQLPGLTIDGKVVITSREALQARDVPNRAVIVGAGATGVEFAHLWQTYGAEVTLVELLPRLVPQEDEDISKHLEKEFRKQGIKSLTASSVSMIDVRDGYASVTVSGDNGESSIECDRVLVAIGAQGNIDNLGLEGSGVAVKNGYVPVNDSMRTNVQSIYAIGDVTGPPLLAHVASAQGVTAVEHIAGLNPPKLDYELMPRGTYCQPQIASFGLTEAQARERGLAVKIGTFPYVASGKALAMAETEGMVKLVIEEDVGDILGAHMIGAEATEMLGELSLARLLEATSSELGWLVHPHPTISEMVKEAALDADGEAIHK